MWHNERLQKERFRTTKLMIASWLITTLVILLIGVLTTGCAEITGAACDKAKAWCQEKT